MTGGTEQCRLYKMDPDRQPVMHRQFRADPSTVRDTLIFMREQFAGSASPEVLSRLELALAETLNNVCQHGDPVLDSGRVRPDGPPLIHLWIVRHVGGIACAVTDDGIPLPADCLAPRALRELSLISEDSLALPEGGFGWFLIQNVASSLSYFREGPRNFLAFTIPVAETQLPIVPTAAAEQAQV
ncbi:ATP-binding protein [Paracoccus ravus]|uniref:ATP-binding protein n=1 Tax=Paracoccus ravus TaxID=2447760 RepID=UPI00106E9238|nr:ATP-binding protein [Paracoccus ravus]